MNLLQKSLFGIFQYLKGEKMNIRKKLYFLFLQSKLLVVRLLGLLLILAVTYIVMQSCSD
ncbi:hypothetical protein LEP1GSC170_1607 [Leptospira interrogans serovar Bataviae str. HAI135]|nr:hypothetical protein LEP1GSC170_1607 [Leptospira interrogans serovar Bataviae str. HAI135]